MASVGLTQLRPAAQAASDVAPLVGDKDGLGPPGSADLGQGVKFAAGAGDRSAVMHPP